MFTQKCYIRINNKAITDNLSDFGYKLLFSARKNQGKYLVCANKFCFGQDDELPTDYIYCGEDIELFLSIAALRDDSDKNQLFFNNKDIDCEYPMECIHNEFYMFAIDRDTCEYIDNGNKYHKGTPQELLKHFKK